jgi:hypothetical protein
VGVVIKTMFERIGKSMHVALVVGASTVAWAANASASTTYAVVLNTDFGYPPDCTVCHSTVAGGPGTAVKPFAMNLVSNYGLAPMLDDDSFRAIIAQLTTDDSDMDGASDRLELEELGDPNDPAVLPGGFTPPLVAEYGCLNISRGPAGPDALGSLGAGLVALLLASRLRRRRRR